MSRDSRIQNDQSSVPDSLAVSTLFTSEGLVADEPVLTSVAEDSAGMVVSPKAMCFWPQRSTSSDDSSRAAQAWLRTRVSRGSGIGPPPRKAGTHPVPRRASDRSLPASPVASHNQADRRTGPTMRRISSLVRHAAEVMRSANGRQALACPLHCKVVAS